MRVLIVGQYFWPENFRINEIAHSMVRAGCWVSVLTGPPNYPDGSVFPGYSSYRLRSQHYRGLLIRRIPLIPRGRGSSLRLAFNYASFVASACMFGPWMLRGEDYDVVLVYAPGPLLQAIPALLIGRLKRAPVVTWVQDLWPDSLEVTGHVRNPTILALVRRLVRWIYQRNDLLLVQSRSFAEPVSSLAGSTPVFYQPNPGELSAGASAPSVEPALVLPGGFSVVFAGNLGTVQALDTVLEAAEGTRDQTDLWWVLIGSGSRLQWVQDEVRRRKLNQIVLPGRFAPEAMPSILAQASVLLVTLVRNPAMSRTIPSKVQAYLAAGRPILAALDGEGSRVVEEAQAGLTTPAEDAGALRAAVLNLKAMSAEELRRFGENGQRYYREHFDPDNLTRSILQRFRELVGTTPEERSSDHSAN